MRNSDDAKLIAGAIEKAGRLISDAIKENTRLTAQRTPRYQIPERANDQILFRNSLSSCSPDSDTTGTGDDLTGDDTVE